MKLRYGLALATALAISLGACATMGGVNKMKNNFDLNEVRECVYGKDGQMPHLDTYNTKAVDEVVEVDFKIHGCPINGAEFAQIVRALLVPRRAGDALAAAAPSIIPMSKPLRRLWTNTV